MRFLKTESSALNILDNRRLLTTMDRRECEKVLEKCYKIDGELLFIVNF